MSEVKIPEGYKQSEIGVIPEDWETKNIGEDATLKARIGWQALTTNEYQSIGNHYLVTGTDFNAGEVQWDTCWHVDEWRYKQDSNIQLRIDDVLVTKDGTIGKVGYVDELPKPATLNSGVFVIRPKYNSFVPKYFFYVLTSSLFKEFIRNITAGSTITHLYQKDFVTFNFPVPPKQEQTAIATALSDVDNLIQSLEKLIAKKDAIKTGTMQQLLTGKTRLPEFATCDDGSPKGFKQTELGRIPEDWNYKALSEMTENKGLVRGPFGGALKKDSFVRIGFKVYEQRNAIYANTEIGKYYIDKDKFNELQRFTVKPKDFIVSCSGTIGRIYQIPVNAPEGIINQALLKITLSKNTDEHFFYQIFNSKEFQESITDSTQGGAMKNLIGMSEFKKSVMLMPPKTEQTAIATILSDIDTEFQALQQRLEKTKDIKQGMMQQLLTGKVRLAY